MEWKLYSVQPNKVSGAECASFSITYKWTQLNRFASSSTFMAKGHFKTPATQLSDILDHIRILRNEI